MRFPLRSDFEELQHLLLLKRVITEPGINLADTLGHEEMAREFESALEHGAQHVENVRSWLAEQVLEKAQA